MKKILSLFLAFVFNAYGGTNENPYQKITERNAFELTDKEPAPPLPPAEKILAPNIFLTGISRWKGTNKVHLVLRKVGEPDKFVSLGENEKQYNVKLKKILRDAVLVSTNGNDKLLNFEKNGLPTTITKRAPQKDPKKEDKKIDERRRQYEEWRKKKER
jgi:type II secretory pathway component PulC